MSEYDQNSKIIVKPPKTPLSINNLKFSFLLIFILYLRINGRIIKTPIKFLKKLVQMGEFVVIKILLKLQELRKKNMTI